MPELGYRFTQIQGAYICIYGKRARSCLQSLLLCLLSRSVRHYAFAFS